MVVQPLDQVTADLDGEVQRLLDTLHAGVDTIADEMVETITSEIPAYARPGAAQLVGDVRAHCRTHAALMVDCMREDREPRRDELGFARGAAARRVSQGIPLEALLHAFRLGHRTIWDAIVRWAPDTTLGHQAALSLARPAMQYIDAASSQVAESYLKEEQRLLATADRERRDLLENLLAGRLPDPIAAPAAAAGIDRHDRLLVAVARVCSTEPADPNDAHRAADVVAAQTAGPDAEPLVVVRQGEIVAVIPAGDMHADPLARLRTAQGMLVERRAMPTRIGVSARFAGLAGVAQGYAEARQALLRATEASSLVALEELSTFDYLVATADPAAWQVARRTAAALEGGALGDTVTAYVDCDLDAGRAARLLGVHPNTVRYRLRRIAEVTGYDPGCFHDLVELATVVRMAGARSHPNPSPPAPVDGR